LIVSLAALVGCSSERTEPAVGQILMYLDTDAPLPRAGGAPTPTNEPQPLFDRVRIDLHLPGAAMPCAGCTNELALDAEMLRDLRASIGIVPPANTTGCRARVRLFHSNFRDSDGAPMPDATIDVTIELPPIVDKEKRSVTVYLSTDDVGRERTATATEGAPTSSRVGTWPPAARVPCAVDPLAGEACFAGGAFWMGRPGEPWDVLPGHDSNRPRLVVLSPFFLGTTEITVETYRASGGPSPTPWSGSLSGDTIVDFCSFTSAPGPREVLPVNCLHWAAAQQFCEERGGSLPTEAQFEYASGGGLGRTFPWGDDQPGCSDAVFSRLGWGVFRDSLASCKPPSPPGGPAPIGSGARDRIELPGGPVLSPACSTIPSATSRNPRTVARSARFAVATGS
jgi:hypothetical protein